MVLDAAAMRLIPVVQKYEIAIFAITMWDWVVCLQKEYNRIWKGNWTVIKTLYMCNRYYSIFITAYTIVGNNGNWTAEQCARMHRWQPGLAAFITVFAELILIIRTYALWGKDKRVLAVLLFAFLVECGFIAYSVFQFIPVPVTDLNDSTSRGVCVTGGGPGGHDWTMAYWLAPIAVDTLMLGLTVYRALQLHRSGVKSTLFQTFIRDGLLYFAVVFVVNLINTIFYSFPSQALQTVNNPMSMLITSIMCSRIILSLRSDEKESKEAVSREWQNTFLKRKHGNSGTTSGTTGSSTFQNPFRIKKTSTFPITIQDSTSHHIDTYPSPLSYNDVLSLPSPRSSTLGGLRAHSPAPSTVKIPHDIHLKPLPRIGLTKGIKVDVETGYRIENMEKEMKTF